MTGSQLKLSGESFSRNIMAKLESQISLDCFSNRYQSSRSLKLVLLGVCASFLYLTIEIRLSAAGVAGVALGAHLSTDLWP